MIRFAHDEYFRNIYINYLSVAKSCTAANDVSCWHENGQWSDLRGVPQVYFYDSGIILSNGARVTIFGGGYWPDNDNCTDTSLGISVCGEVFVDVNGIKGQT